MKYAWEWQGDYQTGFDRFVLKFKVEPTVVESSNKPPKESTLTWIENSQVSNWRFGFHTEDLAREVFPTHMF